MSAYATAVSEMTRENLIAELFRHKEAKDAAKADGIAEGRRQMAAEAAAWHEARRSTLMAEYERHKKAGYPKKKLAHYAELMGVHVLALDHLLKVKK